MIPMGGTLNSGTSAWHQTKAGAWPRFRTCLGRTLGQPHCLILMGIACTEAWGPQPCRSFSHVLGQIEFLITPSKALRTRGSAGRGAVTRSCPWAVCWCVALFKNPGKEKEKVLGLWE